MDGCAAVPSAAAIQLAELRADVLEERRVEELHERAQPAHEGECDRDGDAEEQRRQLRHAHRHRHHGRRGTAERRGVLRVWCVGVCRPNWQGLLSFFLLFLCLLCLLCLLHLFCFLLLLCLLCFLWYLLLLLLCSVCVIVAIVVLPCGGAVLCLRCRRVVFCCGVVLLSCCVVLSCSVLWCAMVWCVGVVRARA